MKKFKNKLKEMHSTTLRFIIAMLGVYYLIQLIINGVLKDGLIFTAGLAYPGLLYDSETENKKYIVDSSDSVFACNDGRKPGFFHPNAPVPQVLLLKERQDRLLHLLLLLVALGWPEIVLFARLRETVLQPPHRARACLRLHLLDSLLVGSPYM